MVHYIAESKQGHIVSTLVILYYTLFAGAATQFINSLDFRLNPAGLILYLSCWFIMVPMIKKPFLKKGLLITIAVVLIWMTAHLFMDKAFDFVNNFTFAMNILTAYLLCRAFGKQLLPLFVKAVTILSVISLGCWIVELLIGNDVLCDIAPFKSNWGEEAGSFIFFHVIKEVNAESQMINIIRNCGFSWEPGRFASLVVIAFAVNIIVSKRRTLFTKTNIILTLALISTFSTTGYVAYLFVISIYSVFEANFNKKKKVFSLLFCVLAFIVAYNLPFVSDKIQLKFNHENFLTESSNIDISQFNEQRTLDRFEGIYLDWQNFLHAPLLGYGLSNENRFVFQTISEFLISSNGITKPLAQYGLLLGIPFFLLFFFSTKMISRLFQFKTKWMLFFIIMIVSISYGFEDDPLFRAISLFAIFTRDTKRYAINKISIKYNNGLL